MTNCGGWLTGHQIQSELNDGNITIQPFNPSNINSNSYNYTLSNKLLRHDGELVDLKVEDNWIPIDIPRDGIILEPGELYLGCTVEVLGSRKYASLITGRSSIGRKFVTNHVCAGLVDQGFFGQVTLEIVVSKKTKIYPFIKFGQMFWFTTFGEAMLYRGKYQGQRGPTVSQLCRDEEENIDDTIG